MANVKDLGLANNEIVSVQKTSGTGLPGSIDTYTITVRDGTTFTFNVTNGNNGLSELSRQEFTDFSAFMTFSGSNKGKIACIVFKGYDGTNYDYDSVIFSFGSDVTGKPQVSLKYMNRTSGNWVSITSDSLSTSSSLIVYYFENAAGVSVVPTSRTIAGLSLENDIETDALNLQLFKNGLGGNNKVNYERTLGIFIHYSNGAIGYSGNYFQAWFIYKPTFKYVRAFVQNNDTGLAAIAFFNSINVGADSYMKSDSVQISSTSKDGVVETAKVPDGCEAVVISSRNDNITPDIWFSDDEFSTFYERLHFLVSCSTENTKLWGYNKVLQEGTVIKIVVKTWNYKTPMAMYLHGNAEGKYSIMLTGTGSYYWKLPFSCTGVYLSDVSGNITYDIYTVENPYANFPKSNNIAYPFLRLSTKVFNIINSTNKYNVTQGGWINNNTTGVYKEIANTTRLSTQRLKFSGGRVKITFNGSDIGYDYAIGEITNDKIDWLVSDTSWIHPASRYFTITNGRDFIISFRKTDNSVLTYQDLLDDNVSLTIECDELYNNLNNYFEESLLLEKATKDIDYTKYTKTLYPSYEYKKCSHLLIDKTSGSNVIIPSQSIFDVSMCARLGFKVVEGNIHATATPGKYIVMHGDGGKIGGQLVDPLGTDISNVVISSTSFSTLRSYVYRSQYDKYKIPVSSLEEWLYACKNNGLIPLLNYIDDTELKIIKGIVGENFIMDKIGTFTRTKFSGLGHVFSATYTKAQAIAWCTTIKPPLTIFAADYTGYTDEQLKDLINTIHSYGCMIGIVGAYSNEIQVQRCMQLGFDADATGYAVNQFNNGNLANLSNDLTYADFSHNGTVTDGLLTLTTGQTLGLQNALSSQFLAKVQLRIVFNGTLNITLGGYINSTQLTSDGTKECIISTYILNGTPTLTLTAVANTDIISIDYKASKC